MHPKVRAILFAGSHGLACVPPFALRNLVGKMVKAIDEGKEEMRFGMLWLVSYCFLLRLPSEVSHKLCCL